MRAYMSLLILMYPCAAFGAYYDTPLKFDDIKDACFKQAGGPGDTYKAGVDINCIVENEKIFGSYLTQAYQALLRNIAGEKRPVEDEPPSPAKVTDQIEKLRKSERAWLQFQATTCAFEGSRGYRAEDNKLLFVQCNLRTTIERLGQLRNYFTG